mgnify:CR=1 FL=1
MAATDTAPAGAPAGHSDALVIGLVGLAHMLSHFYQIALAPLFPLLRDEFAVSYTALGLIVSLFYGVSGMCQAFVGILVDRYGGDRLMLFGITTMATSVLLMGLAPAYWVLLPLAVTAALGNCVFHPADLAILTAKVSPARIGRAFGIHGISPTGAVGSTATSSHETPSSFAIPASVVAWPSAAAASSVRSRAGRDDHSNWPPGSSDRPTAVTASSPSVTWTIVHPALASMRVASSALIALSSAIRTCRPAFGPRRSCANSGVGAANSRPVAEAIGVSPKRASTVDGRTGRTR